MPKPLGAFKLWFSRVAISARVQPTLERLRHPRFSWALWLAGVIVVSTGWASHQPGVLAFAAVLLFVACLVRVLSAIREAFVALAVLLAFALFLMSRLITSVVFNYPAGSTNRYGMPFDSSAVDSHVFLSLALALAGFFLSLPILSFLGRPSRGWVTSHNVQSDFVLAARRASIVVFCVALPLQLARDVEISIFVSQHGYLDYYTEFQTALPDVVRLIGGALHISFLAYLATNPSKRAITIPTIAYMVAAAVSLGTGQRTQFALSAAIVFLFIAYRHLVEDPSGRWITARIKVGTVLIAPVALVLSGVIAQMRTTYGPRGSGLLTPILDPLYAQGASVEVIGYGYVYQAQTAHTHLYSFGPLLDLFQRHLPALVGMGPGVLTGQTVDRATNSGYFSHAISYLVMPDKYLRGYGLGSSFVAELWADFSYPGVLIGSFFIGLVVIALTLGLRHSWATRTVSLLLIREILLIPRQGPTQFLVQAGTFSTVIGAILIVGIALLMTRNFRLGPVSLAITRSWRGRRATMQSGPRKEEPKS